MAWQRELDVAEAAVLRAAQLTKRVQSSVAAVAKPDATPVTAADLAAQALVVAAVAAAFPGDAFVGEDAGALRKDPALRRAAYCLFADAHPGPCPSEAAMLDLVDAGSGAAADARRFWTLDPVDGTAAFLRGQQYAVALALIEDGREVVGVLACPNLRPDDVDGSGCGPGPGPGPGSGAPRIRESRVDARGLGIVLSAARGHGAALLVPRPPSGPPSATPGILRRLPLPPRQPPPALAAVHIVDCALNPPARRAPVRRLAARRLAARLGAPFPGTDVWSSHVRYAALVGGGGDVLLRISPAGRPAPPSSVWDHAGAQLIYAEVGGKVTDLDDRPFDFGTGRLLSRNRGLVAAHGDIHDHILALARELADAPDEPPVRGGHL